MVPAPAPSEPQGSGAAAGVAPAVAVGVAAAGVGAVDVAAGTQAADATVASGKVVAGLIAFLASLRTMHERWLVSQLGRYSRSSDDIRQVVEDEMRREVAFAQASADRLASALPQAMRIDDPQARATAVRKLLDAEERYAQQRSEAMAARAIAAVTRVQLRRDSPLGAYWRLGRAADHTSGCVFMAGGDREGDGRFWPWAVLDRVHPPRHYGCTSTLHGFGEAVANGWMTAGDVPDARVAVRQAAGVLMEQAEVDALLRELDVRELLAERGIETNLIPFAGVIERDERGEDYGATNSICAAE